jgi:hypothetical protein
MSKAIETGSTPKACTACYWHRLHIGRPSHVCINPAVKEFMPEAVTQADDSNSTFVICDEARRMDKPCGPRGGLWVARLVSGADY